MDRNSNLVVVVSCLLAAAPQCGWAAELTDSSDWVIFRAEAAAVRDAVSGECPKCYFAKMMGMVFPIPDRYLVQMSPIEESQCVSFVSPALQRLRTQYPEIATELIRRGFGLIKFCPVAGFASAIQRLEASHPPDERSRHGTFQIKLWHASGLRAGTVSVFVSNGTDGLWIADQNPHLWSAMLDAADPSP